MDTCTGLPVVGLVGDGHLVRMTRLAAMTLGQTPVLVAATEVTRADHPAAVRDLLPGCDAVAVIDDPPPLQYPTVTAPPALVALVARSPFGQIAAYPLVEVRNLGHGGIQTMAPPSRISQCVATDAQQVAIGLAHQREAVGLLTVVLCHREEGSGGGELSVSEVLSGPHPVGHWTAEGARTSQCEQYLRAILDYPLGETGQTAPVVVTRTIVWTGSGTMGLDERLHHLYGEDPGVRVHLYGVPLRQGATIGHVTVLGRSPSARDDIRHRAASAVRWLREGTDGTADHRRDYGKRLGLADDASGRGGASGV